MFNPLTGFGLDRAAGQVRRADDIDTLSFSIIISRVCVLNQPAKSELLRTPDFF